jgi:hypothetical protein
MVLGSASDGLTEIFHADGETEAELVRSLLDFVPRLERRNRPFR